MNIFDTNCLLYHPEIFEDFENVVIPYTVLEELDKLKTDKITGYTARRAVRKIKDNNIRCRDFNKSHDFTDDALLEIIEENGGTLYSNDYLVYLKGKARELNVQLYDPQLDTYKGVVEKQIEPSQLDKMMKHNNIGWSGENLDVNTYIDFNKVIGKYKEGTVFKIPWSNKHKVNGIDTLNNRQIMAYDALTDSSIKVVVLWGKAGTGKTALATKLAMQQMRSEKYDNVLLSRPNIEIGEELGILPGGIEDKQSPFIAPFKDNMSSIQLSSVPEIQPLSTVKGRDIKDTFYVIDEAQDIPPENIITLVERMGEGSKIIFTGDVRQIDKNGLTPKYNGITFLSNALRGSELFACIELTEVERSETAKLGDKLRENLN